MPKRTRSLILAGAPFLPLFLPQSLSAWSAHGHRAVALVAERRLSGPAKAGVDAVLGPGITLAGIAACADALRGDLAEDPQDDPVGADPIDHSAHTVSCGGITWQEEGRSRPWHYINIPITDSPRDAAGLKAYCANSDCIVDQIALEAEVLGQPSASQSDKQKALMFLVHFVGDLHQPLHSATEVVGRTDDRGGNLKWVRFNGAKLRLHSLWDHVIEVKDSFDADALSQTLEREIAAKTGAVSSWTAGDFVTAAALESLKVGQDDIYPHYYSDDNQNLGSAYRNLMQPKAFDRMERAGVRLAALLESALGGQQVPTHNLVSPEKVSEDIRQIVPADGRLDW